MTYSNLYARLYTTRQRIMQAFKAIFNCTHNLQYLLVIAFFQALAWFQVFFISKHLSSDYIILHYNVDFGIDYATDPKMIFFWPVFGLAIFLVNLLLLATLNKKKDFKLFFHLLLSTVALANLLLNLVIFSIYLQNFR